jgi:curved DNA-binding protein
MADRDFYSVLGLSKGASDADIKKAYRKLARDLHPDRNPDDPSAEDRFKDVSHAYQVLSDPEKRKLYDEFGEAGLKEGFDPEAYRQYQRYARGGGGFGGGTSFEDLFGGRASGRGATFDIGDLFGGRGGMGGMGDAFGGFGRAAARGRDLQSEITLDFADALRGSERELSFSRPGSPNGHRTVKVRIPPGAKDGSKLRLRGQGGPGPEGGEAGDLLLTVRVRPHDHFWREDDDLHLELPVTALEAYQGAKVPVPTLDGDVNLRVPAGSQSGAKLRLRGKGAPKQGGSAKGDLIVHLEVRLPEDKGDEKVVELLKELEERYDKPVRRDIRL